MSHYFHIKIPNPFKIFKINPKFQEDTQILLQRFKTHKKKVIFVGLSAFALWNRSFLANQYYWLEDYVYSKINKNLEKDSKIDQIAQNFSKQSLAGTFKNPLVQKESIDFLEKIFNEKQTVNNLLSLLLKVVKEKSFVQEGKNLGKEIGLSLTQDKEIEEETKKMLIRIFDSSDVKFQSEQLVKHIFKEPDTQEALVLLFAEAFQDFRIKQAIKLVLQEALYEIL